MMQKLIFTLVLMGAAGISKANMNDVKNLALEKIRGAGTNCKFVDSVESGKVLDRVHARSMNCGSPQGAEAMCVGTIRCTTPEPSDESTSFFFENVTCVPGGISGCALINNADALGKRDMEKCLSDYFVGVRVTDVNGTRFQPDTTNQELPSGLSEQGER